jgi:hypothetical protein
VLCSRSRGLNIELAPLSGTGADVVAAAAAADLPLVAVLVMASRVAVGEQS